MMPNTNQEDTEKENSECGDEIEIPEPQNMKLVKVEHDKLKSAINEIGNRVSGVLENQENEFLVAYRSHMRNIQKDFSDLRDDINEKEKAIQNNVLVKQLERERDWYKKEALHLDQLLLKTKKREGELTEKMEELEQDRTWLSNQLKTVMKQKNTLELQLQVKEKGEIAMIPEMKSVEDVNA